MSAPEVKVTPPNPLQEEPSTLEHTQDSSDTITEQPTGTNAPTLKVEQNDHDSNSSQSDDDDDSSTISTLPSRVNQSNECSEFCIECSTCFGLLDACCPSDSEGCLTTAATFIGNLIFACCKC